MAIVRLTPKELHGRIASGETLVLLDVREPHEVEICALGGSVHIPMGELGRRHVELDPSAPTVCICHHGVRSAHVAAALERLGFSKLFNLSGGIDRWAEDVERTMARY